MIPKHYIFSFCAGLCLALVVSAFSKPRLTVEVNPPNPPLEDVCSQECPISNFYLLVVNERVVRYGTERIRWAAWSNAVTAGASTSGVGTGNFDDMRTNRWISWSHTFALDSGGCILSAAPLLAVSAILPRSSAAVLAERRTGAKSAKGLPFLARTVRDLRLFSC